MQHHSVRLIVILGLLAMLTPLAIDMYLPALPAIAQQFSVPAGHVQLTLSSYMLGFAVGQLFYGPLSDSVGRKPVVIGGVLVFALAGFACALTQNIEHLIVLRLLHGLAAAAAGVVINALLRDMFSGAEFSRMMSFVILVMTVAPLIAPVLGGLMLKWFDWHAIFIAMSAMAILAALLVMLFIPETLPKEKRQRLHLTSILINFATLFRHRRVMLYMIASGFSFAGMFTFLNAGPFVYIQLNGVSPQQFGYYFSLNVAFLFVMTLINSRLVGRYGSVHLGQFGLIIQLGTALWLVLVTFFHWPFVALVLGVALFVSVISMVSSNIMAIIMEDFPHMAGMVSSLAGTIRFGLGALVGSGLSLLAFHSAWPMVLSMLLCAGVALLCFFLARRSPAPH